MGALGDLVAEIRDRRTILFVGAGVSKNLNLPTYAELMDHVAEELDFDPRIFSSLGAPPALAEFYKIKAGSFGPLRSWMDREWHKPDIRVELSRTHELIVRLDFPVIYTTNFDRWLERAFDHWGRAYVKIANVGDLRKENGQQTQIVKLHGDFDDDGSIVLAESDHFRRLSFEDPLDIKFRSDALTKGILFIGYALNDINMRYLLFKLQNMWESYKGAAKRPQSYIFLARPNEVEEAILETRGVRPIISDVEDPREGLEAFLEELHSELPSQERP
jgi:SIR2-like domain